MEYFINYIIKWFDRVKIEKEQAKEESKQLE